MCAKCAGGVMSHGEILTRSPSNVKHNIWYLSPPRNTVSNINLVGCNKHHWVRHAAMNYGINERPQERPRRLNLWNKSPRKGDHKTWWMIKVICIKSGFQEWKSVVKNNQRSTGHHLLLTSMKSSFFPALFYPSCQVFLWKLRSSCVSFEKWSFNLAVLLLPSHK